MAGVFNVGNVPNLGAVVMPLVKLLADGDLSWDDREKVAAAIRSTLRHHQGMKQEAMNSAIGGALAGKQAASGLGQQNCVPGYKLP